MIGAETSRKSPDDRPFQSYAADVKFTLRVVGPGPEKGFHFPYVLKIPSTPRHGVTVLVVESNNDCRLSDEITMLERTKLVEQSLSEPWGAGSFCAGCLKAPVLMPVFPRDFGRDDASFVHQLDSATLAAGGKNERVDKQLMAMVDDALAWLRAQGFEVQDRVISAGFSSSAVFATRWSFLHYDRVLATLAGGIGGIVPLPVSSIKGAALGYPLGANDYSELMGRPFDVEAFKLIPKFYFNGTQDSSCPFYFDGDDLTEAEAVIVQEQIAKVSRAELQYPLSISTIHGCMWATIVEVYKEHEVLLDELRMEGAGHEMAPAFDPIEAWLKTHIL